MLRVIARARRAFRTWIAWTDARWTFAEIPDAIGRALDRPDVAKRAVTIVGTGFRATRRFKRRFFAVLLVLLAAMLTGGVIDGLRRTRTPSRAVPALTQHEGAR
ncbi:MAG TPA: hypothetical protein VGM90_16225 [Kofleriaceae bacterium]